MKRWIHANSSVVISSGVGHKIVYYIGTYPDRRVFHTDGFQTDGFTTEEDAQAALDEIYEEEYYRNRYPGLRVLSRSTYSVWHD